MSKAINWPSQFRDEVLGEDTAGLHCALRLGRMYYENQYWVPDEVVDIRVNHLKIRKAKIVGELKLCPIKDLSATDLAQYKSTLRTPEAVAAFLAGNYQQPVDANTEVTVVYYKNMPIVPEDVEVQDDSHM